MKAIFGTKAKLFINNEYIGTVIGLEIIINNWWSAWIKRTPKG